MAGRIRGQEVTVSVLVDGAPQEGSMARVQDFTVTPRQDLLEEPFLGEVADRHDIQQHGWDLSFTVPMEEANLTNLLQEIVRREELHLPHPDVTINVIYAFRNGLDATMESYYDVFLKVGDQSIGGRKEFVTVSYEAKASRRNVITL